MQAARGCQHLSTAPAALLHGVSSLALRTAGNVRENARDLALQPCKLHFQHHLSWMEDHVHARRQFAEVQAYRFSHTAADAIPFHGAAQDASGGQAYTRQRAGWILT